MVHTRSTSSSVADRIMPPQSREPGQSFRGRERVQGRRSKKRAPPESIVEEVEKAVLDVVGKKRNRASPRHFPAIPESPRPHHHHHRHPTAASPPQKHRDDNDDSRRHSGLAHSESITSEQFDQHAMTDSEISGTQLEVQEMDANLIFETVPELAKNAAKILNLLILNPSPDPVRNLRLPGSAISKRLRLYERAFNASKTAFGSSDYLSPHVVETATNTAILSPVLHWANLAVLAQFILTSPETSNATSRALEETERDFPAQFGDTVNAGDFDIALELWTQTLILTLGKYSHRNHFNPDVYLRRHFFIDAGSDDDDDYGDEVEEYWIRRQRVKLWPQMKESKELQLRIRERISRIRSTFKIARHEERRRSGKDIVSGEDLVDFEELSAMFPWGTFVSMTVDYIKVRARALSNGGQLEDLIAKVQDNERSLGFVVAPAIPRSPILRNEMDVAESRSGQLRSEVQQNEAGVLQIQQNEAVVQQNEAGPAESRSGHLDSGIQHDEMEIADSWNGQLNSDIQQNEIEVAESRSGQLESGTHQSETEVTELWNDHSNYGIGQDETVFTESRNGHLDSCIPRGVSTGASTVTIAVTAREHPETLQLEPELRSAAMPLESISEERITLDRAGSPKPKIPPQRPSPVPSAPDPDPKLSWVQLFHLSRMKDALSGALVPQSPPQPLSEQEPPPELTMQEMEKQVNLPNEPRPSSEPPTTAQGRKRKFIDPQPGAKRLSPFNVQQELTRTPAKRRRLTLPSQEEDEDEFEVDTRPHNSQLQKKSRRYLPPAWTAEAEQEATEQLPRASQEPHASSSPLFLPGSSASRSSSPPNIVPKREPLSQEPIDVPDVTHIEPLPVLDVQNRAASTSHRRSLRRSLDAESLNETHGREEERLARRVNRIAKTNREEMVGRRRQSRKFWSREAEDLLIEKIGEFGCQWSAIRDLEEPLFAGRTDVQLKDKARNLKFYFLKVRLPLPHGFDEVTISKKQIEQLREMGIELEYGGCYGGEQ